MCGIAGVLTLADTPPEPALVMRMLGRLAHRGPDDEGCLSLGPAVLGMRRLSILDPTPRGHQPMTSSDGRYTVVHNGEIYNFLELADELAARGHSFATETDTEVILAAYSTWGPACLERFNGIWAFALWDAAEQALFLARDRFGVKPLFVVEGGGTLAFASEIKALRMLPWVSAEPDFGAVHDYLADGSVDRGTRTFFRDIRRFPAAESLLVSRGRRRQRRYWTVPELSTDASFRPRPGDRERIEEFRALLVDAVALQLRSDVPIGSCLSGGVDSSSIVSIAAHLRAVASGGVGADRTHTERDASPQLAFFAEFREGGIDERPYVDAVVAATGITLHTTTPDDNLFLASLDDVIEAQDEPFGSLSVLAQFHVMRIARAAGVKVLLDGQGADELLAGYLNYVGIRFAGGLRQRDPLTLLGAGRAAIVGRGPFLSTLGYALLGSRRLPARLVRGRMPTEWIGPATRGMEPSPRPPAPGPGTLLARKLWSDVASDNLPGLLRYEDRNSMAFGIEARVPFLDHRLVEASFALPDRLKIPTRSRRKAVLHEAMRGIVPDVVLGRRDKVAFQPPERRWLVAAEPRWRLLASSSVAEREQLISPGTISGSLDAFKAGKVRGSVLWRVLNLELWLRGLESPRIGGP